MTYDAFTCFKELELLEPRLPELNPVVDRFVMPAPRRATRKCR